MKTTILPRLCKEIFSSRYNIFLIVLLLSFAMAAYSQSPLSGLRIITSPVDTPVEDPPENPDDPDPGEYEGPPVDDVLIDGTGASRTSGVAPLYVHFTAGFINEDNPTAAFLYYDYEWDFDDSGSGVWAVSGKSKNTATGAVAAHVFENPGTYNVTVTVRDSGGIIGTESHEINVIDPDVYYEGSRTICVSDTSDFTGSPSGALTVTTNNLSSITQYAQSGRRILFRRGGEWTVSGLDWPDNSGPVTIGAFGPGENPNQLGIYDNAPQITVNGGSFLNMDQKQNWRIMDISLRDPSYSNYAISSAFSFQRHLLFRIKTRGFSNALGWSHWNSSDVMTIREMAIVSCDLSDTDEYLIYAGGERLAIMGNVASRSRTTHITRIWQSYLGVVSHNSFSGSSQNNTNGRHALKMHGPGYSSFEGLWELGVPEPNTPLLEHRTEYSIISDNVIGSSGPWPVAIGPQDGAADEQISKIIFERNKILSQPINQGDITGDTGNEGLPVPVNVAMHVWGRYFMIRNNVFDGTGASDDYTAILVEQRGIEPAPVGIEILNNTIYRNGGNDGIQTGIGIGSTVTSSVVKNNYVSFLGSFAVEFLVNNNGSRIEVSSNLNSDSPGLLDPNNPDPLFRNYNLVEGSAAINQGVDVHIFEDFTGTNRNGDAIDLGAFEY